MDDNEISETFDILEQMDDLIASLEDTKEEVTLDLNDEEDKTNE